MLQVPSLQEDSPTMCFPEPSPLPFSTASKPSQLHQVDHFTLHYRTDIAIRGSDYVYFRGASFYHGLFLLTVKAGDTLQ